MDFTTFMMYFLSILAVGFVVFLLIKKIDIKMSLLGVGMILTIAAMMLGQVEVNEFNHIFFPFQDIIAQFRATLPGAGLIILILGGYTAYMSAIGANEVTVNTLTKPLKGIKSVYILVPIVFLMGNLLSLVIPSASNLAIILLATLYPVLRQSGMKPITAAAVIATTATVMPTPLGGDNIAIAAELGIPVAEYVFRYHAIVSIPTLLLMALVHFVWQKYCDAKVAQEVGSEMPVEETPLDVKPVNEVTGGALFKTVYTILPLLPIVILLLVFGINFMLPDDAQIIMGVEIVSLISFLIAIIAEFIRKRNTQVVLKDTENFFKGMAGALGIVILLVAAGVFVRGLQNIGVIEHLQLTMETTEVAGFVLPLILVLLTAVIVLLSGSGTALFFAMVPLMVPLADAAGISPFAVTVPMGLAGNLLRAVSPVSAVIVIVAGTTKIEPLKLVKRTAVPMIAGVIFMFILSMIFFL